MRGGSLFTATPTALLLPLITWLPYDVGGGGDDGAAIVSYSKREPYSTRTASMIAGARKFVASSASLRVKPYTEPWKSLPPDLLTTLMTPPELPPNSAL